jgi:predicted GNAT family acetyltransferase
MNQGNAETAYFFPEISPFVGLQKWDQPSQEQLFDILPAGRTVSTMINPAFELADSFEPVFSLMLYQLVCSSPKPYKQVQAPIKTLDYSFVPAMIELTALTKPGPFVERTIDFGNYMGVLEEGKLLAMAGERLHLPDYTEVSAVCTHPDHLGKGYAAGLVNHLTNQIIGQGKSAFLHVRQDNERAIELYKGLGYEIRTEMYFAVIKPKK